MLKDVRGHGCLDRIRVKEVRAIAKVHGADARSTEGETRREIMLLILKAGQISATQLAEQLGLSATGIRRHLDVLVDEGLAELAPARRSHGRGRPAKAFRLTASGRAQFGHEYDTLAALALETLRETAGQEAVKSFALKRVERILQGIAAPSARDEASIRETAAAVVEAFSNHGYAATVTQAGKGVQICQHHCPIAEVAQEFPELCEAEHQVIAELLGHHVQPLASIADGHNICTTNIPITPIHTHKKGAVDD
nr:metalloregulator ArsR/SmtB family transcription factor [Corynebacterium sp. 76QC2CO]